MVRILSSKLTKVIKMQGPQSPPLTLVELIPNYTCINSKKYYQSHYCAQHNFKIQQGMHSGRMCTVCCSGHLMGGGCLPGEVSAQGVVCLGVCLPRGCLPGGLSAQGDVCLGGGSAQGQCLPTVCLGVSVWGVCLGGVYPGGVCPGLVSAWGCTRIPPVDRILDTHL